MFTNETTNNSIKFQNIQTAHKAHYKRKKKKLQQKTTQSKNRWKPKWTFHQRRHTESQEAHEKMFNVTNY